MKNTDRSSVQVTLIDKNSYHLFTPSLYELATAEEITKNVCIPLKEILPGISMIKDKVLKIKGDEVQLKNQKVNFDYLIIALGSETAYYEIPGLKEYSIPLKTLEDGVQIRKLIREKGVVRVLVGGGGATGCELTAEIIHHFGKKVKVSLIQKSPQLVKELNLQASKTAYERFLDAEVNICFGEKIVKVYKDYVQTDTGDKHNFDIFVWTGGVKPNTVQADFERDKRGNIVVNEKLQVKNSTNIFAAGDIAAGYPWIAEVAEDEGKIAGENVTNLINGRLLKSYKFKTSGFVVPLGGKFAVAQIGKFHIKGFLGWLIEQFILLRYLLSILPLTKAFKRWNRFEEYLIK